jgi:carbon storage regulator
MLVLSRRVGEKILIGDNIAVTIVRIAPGIVRVGVEAPAEMPIVREEIKEQLQENAPEPKAAAQT